MSIDVPRLVKLSHLLLSLPAQSEASPSSLRHTREQADGSPCQVKASLVQRGDLTAAQEARRAVRARSRAFLAAEFESLFQSRLRRVS